MLQAHCWSLGLGVATVCLRASGGGGGARFTAVELAGDIAAFDEAVALSADADACL